MLHTGIGDTQMHSVSTNRHPRHNKQTPWKRMFASDEQVSINTPEDNRQPTDSNLLILNSMIVSCKM